MELCGLGSGYNAIVDTVKLWSILKYSHGLPTVPRHSAAARLATLFRDQIKHPKQAYYSLFSCKTGPGSPPALVLLGGVFISGAVIHVVSTSYRKRVEGVDMGMAFKEIPPE
jgi:hypothetical protein